MEQLKQNGVYMSYLVQCSDQMKNHHYSNAGITNAFVEPPSKVAHLCLKMNGKPSMLPAALPPPLCPSLFLSEPSYYVYTETVTRSSSMYAINGLSRYLRIRPPPG